MTPPSSSGPFSDERWTAKSVVEYGRGDIICTQGDPCATVEYIQTGGVKLFVRSATWREAVVARLGPGEFFGEGCLAGQRERTASATAITPTVIVHVPKEIMKRLLHEHHAMSDRFIRHMLARNIRTQEELLDDLSDSVDKRVASRLLRLAEYGTRIRPFRIVPNVSREALAAMLGATQGVINAVLARFTQLGFIEDAGDDTLKINKSLLTVVLRDSIDCI